MYSGVLMELNVGLYVGTLRYPTFEYHSGSGVAGSLKMLTETKLQLMRIL